jgi:hypothetical protein
VELFLDFHGDLNGDGAREFLLHSTQRECIDVQNPGRPEGAAHNVIDHDNRVWVLDENLNKIGDFLIAEQWKSTRAVIVDVCRHQPNGHTEILVLADRAMVLGW